MLWPLARRRHVAAEQAQRLADVRQKNPESETWLALVEAALVESQDATTWDAAVRANVPGRPARAPLLHAAEVGIDGRSARRFVRQLARIAGLNGAAHRLDALELLEAAIRQDDARIDALATGDPSTLRVVAQVALWASCPGGAGRGPPQRRAPRVWQRWSADTPGRTGRATASR